MRPSARYPCVEGASTVASRTSLDGDREVGAAPCERRLGRATAASRSRIDLRDDLASEQWSHASLGRRDLELRLRRALAARGWLLRVPYRGGRTREQVPRFTTSPLDGHAGRSPEALDLIR